jgi:transcriptional regulator GlxA family with amidase domain
MSHEVVVVTHPLVLGMELTGALDLLRFTNKSLTDRGIEPFYRVRLTSVEGGCSETWGGLCMTETESLGSYRGPVDTLLVVGGPYAHDEARDPALVAGVREAGLRADRVVGLCTGAFILGAAGLLDGRRATTHWAFGQLLAARYPQVRVDTDPIFVRAGDTWTSAGITATLDLLLALVSEDVGAEIAREVARYLVMFLQRTGNQRQFSVQLASQVAHRQPIRDVQQYIADHPGSDLSMPRLAERARMSQRHFARVFTAEVGMSPGRYVERVRVETAKRYLEESDLTVDVIAAAAGFGTAESMRRAFHQHLDVSPTDYRRILGSSIRRRLERLAV